MQACRNDTAVPLMRSRLAAALVLCAWTLAPAWAQEESWVRLGGYGIGAGLAGPAGGAVSEVAYQTDGRTLLATAASGLSWISDDGGETWTVALGAAAGTLPAPAEESIAPPEAGATVVRHPYRAGYLFALGRDLYLSRDDGVGWTALTRAEEAPLIGVDQLSIAFDPLDPDRIFVANAFGLWRSSDSGLTWYGLNDRLPNFPAVTFEPGARGAPPRLRTARLGVAELAVGFGLWRRTGAADVETRPEVSPAPNLPGELTAVWRDPEAADVLLAVVAGGQGSRVLRSLDGGEYWDDLTADLPTGELTAITASSETGAVYVAGEAGVFYAPADLRYPAPAKGWTALGESLPGPPVDDVYLEPASGRLYAAVRSFGVYRRRAPDVLGRLRALNAADLSTRPAAPGGLVTVRGAAVGSARIGGLPAPVLAATAGEAQIQIPFQTSGRDLRLELTTSTGPQELALPFARVSPAIFVDRGEPLVLRAATGRLLDLVHPARGGDRLLVLATGLGAVSPPWPAGLPAPLENPPAAVAEVTAKLNGIGLRVVSAALAGGYVGTYLVEVELPLALNAGPAELTLEAGGRSSNSVRLLLAP